MPIAMHLMDSTFFCYSIIQGGSFNWPPLKIMSFFLPPIIINTVFAGGPVPDDAEPLLFIEWINSMYFYICV